MSAKKNSLETDRQTRYGGSAVKASAGASSKVSLEESGNRIMQLIADQQEKLPEVPPSVIPDKTGNPAGFSIPARVPVASSGLVASSNLEKITANLKILFDSTDSDIAYIFAGHCLKPSELI